MTIFVRVAKELIDEVLQESIKDSITKENSARSLFRDTELSENQRKHTRALQTEIANFVSKENDKASLNALKDIIDKADGDVEKLRKEKKWPRGSLNQTLADLSINLERFYRALSALTRPNFQLLEILDDENPYHTLCAHAVYYIGENILLPCDESYLSKAIGLVSQTSVVSIRSQKEECLINNLIKCKETIDTMDKKKEAHDKICKDLVISTIETIQRENQKICKDSKPITTIPIQLTVFAAVNVRTPGMKPSRGRLEESMKNACEEIMANSSKDETLSNTA